MYAVFALLCNPFCSFSQDSIPITLNKQEENFIEFQEHFFKALAQKAILNYKSAIQSLEKCNELKPNNVAVLFELSKNYFELNKHIESTAYAKQALQIEPENRWVLEHLVAVYNKEKNYTEAIKVLLKLVEKNVEKNEQLVLLYFQNNQEDKGKELLLQLDKADLLTPALSTLKNNLFRKNTPEKKEEDIKLLSDFIVKFDENQDFETLKQLLVLAEKEDQSIFLEYSKKAMTLFPTQAVVYLMYSKALNAEKQFSKALEILQNGIDFVIEDKHLEADFYEEMFKSYSGLGNNEAAIKSKNKALELRKK